MLRRINSMPEVRAVGEAPSSVQIHFACPISHEVMAHPVVAADGQLYDRSFIQAWMDHCRTSQTNRTWRSPMTNEAYRNFSLRSVPVLRTFIRTDPAARRDLAASTFVTPPAPQSSANRGVLPMTPMAPMAPVAPVAPMTPMTPMTPGPSSEQRVETMNQFRAIAIAGTLAGAASIGLERLTGEPGRSAGGFTLFWANATVNFYVILCCIGHALERILGHHPRRVD